MAPRWEGRGGLLRGSRGKLRNLPAAAGRRRGRRMSHAWLRVHPAARDRRRGVTRERPAGLLPGLAITVPLGLQVSVAGPLLAQGA
eukprot:15277535-Heterocapsa_arctica.AAC.1